MVSLLRCNSSVLVCVSEMYETCCQFKESLLV